MAGKIGCRPTFPYPENSRYRFYTVEVEMVGIFKIVLIYLVKCDR